MTISDFLDKKKQGKKISMITCYDYSFAHILSQSDIDSILVGDSLAMVMHGHKTTLNATANMMALHTAAVARGAGNKLIVGDLPFLSYRKGLTANMNAIGKIMMSGAHAVKLEGALGNLNLIAHIVQSGIPVMGHLGLTPQSIHQLGGFKVQGREAKAKVALREQAKQLQEAGCFSLVLECVPADIAEQVSAELEIPVIGIGAGSNVDGQVLVLQDMLGMNEKFSPKFLKKYLNGHDLILKSFNQYHEEVVGQKFPTAKESYT